MAKPNGKKLGIGVVMGVTCALVALGLFLLLKTATAEGNSEAAPANTVEGNAATGSAVGEAVPDRTAKTDCEFSAWVGKSAKDAEAAAKATGRAYRMIAPNTAVTQDYRPDRINVETNGKGRNAKVTKVNCG